MIQNYDPDITFAVHTYRYTFQMWDYSVSIDAAVRGNVKGFGNFEHGFEVIVDKLIEEQGDFPGILLKNSDGDTMEWTLGEDAEDPDFPDYEGELSEYCVKIELINHVKD